MVSVKNVREEKSHNCFDSFLRLQSLIISLETRLLYSLKIQKVEIIIKIKKIV